MSGKATNVTAGKPKTSGAVFTAPVGSTLPTDAVTAINSISEAYKDLGYVSEDGLTESISITTSAIKEWGGSIVLITQDEKTATFKFELIEYLNKEVQKFANGDANVSGTLESGMKISVTDVDVDERVLVFWQILRGGIPLRIVVPRCKITAIGDIVYKGNEAVAYDLTVQAIKNDSGQYYDKYMGGASGATGATGAA